MIPPPKGRKVISAVVVQELYTGTSDAFGERLVAQFVRQTEKTGRIVADRVDVGEKAERESLFPTTL